MTALSDRKRRIVNVIVGDYIRDAAPVASDAIARDRLLSVSPATIRNEVAELEEEGYLTRPHPSAGSVPLGKSYRMYVETVAMARSSGDPQPIRALVWGRLEGAEWDLDALARVAADVLAGMVVNMAIATFPKAPESRVKHIEIAPIQELLAMLIVVVGQARLKRQLVRLDSPINAGALEHCARHLQDALGGRSWREIDRLGLELTPLEESLVEATVIMLREEDRAQYLGHYVDGLRNLLAQPEFANRDHVHAVVEAVEDGSLVEAILDETPEGPAVRVVIGEEHEGDVLSPLGVVIGQYGIPGEAVGAIGAVGPIRMEYAKAIPTVDLMTSIMSEVVETVHGG